MARTIAEVASSDDAVIVGRAGHVVTGGGASVLRVLCIAPEATRGRAVGNVTTNTVKNSYLRSEGPLLAVVGLSDVIAVATKDAVLVTSRALSQEVKALVAALDKKGAVETKAHPTVYRPWGSYQSIDGADGFQVKRIIVKPGQKLSLQKIGRAHV